MYPYYIFSFFKSTPKHSRVHPLLYAGYTNKKVFCFVAFRSSNGNPPSDLPVFHIWRDVHSPWVYLVFVFVLWLPRVHHPGRHIFASFLFWF